MRKPLCLTVTLLFFSLPAIALASDLRVSMPGSTIAVTAGKSGPTLQHAIDRKMNDLRDFWFKSRNGIERKIVCDKYCTWDCGLAFNDCANFYGPAGCETCCEEWRSCINDNVCCNQQVDPPTCPAGCPP